MSASWELDFWGKYRRGIEADRASMLASVAAYDSALVSLTAAVANTYLGIRTLQQRIQVAQDNLGTQQESLRIARVQFEAGETSQLDVQQAETQLAQTKAQIPGLRNSLRTSKDSLAVLLGTTPDAIDSLIGDNPALPVAPAQVDTGMPKDLLRRRPDVRQAELAAAAQSAAIGVAKANLYPSFSLTGSFGYVGTSLRGQSVSNLFTWDNRQTDVGAGFVLPILNYGRIINSVRVQDALFQQALLTYENTVLEAQQEVEDARSSFAAAQETLATLADAAASARTTTELAIVRYKEGASDYTTVLTAEQVQLSTEDALASARGAVPEALVAVYRALGGGWQLREGQQVLPQPVRTEMERRTRWGHLPDDGPKLPVVEEAPRKIAVIPMPTDARLAWRCSALLIAAALALGGCGKRNLYQAPPPPTVTVAKPLSQPVTDYLQATGSVAASRTVDLVARVEGYLRSANFVDGSLVKAGDLLFVIEPEQYQAKLAAQKAELLNAQTEYDRQLRMIKENATAQANVDKWRSQRDQAQASVTLAAINLSYTRITAPFTGRIGRHLVDPGNLVGGTGGPTKLATLEQIDPVYIYFSINERDLLNVRAAAQAQGRPLNAGAPRVPVEVGLQTEDGYPHTGTLDFAGTGLDSGSGTLQLRAVMPNAQRVFLPGLFARLRIAVTAPRPELTVPDRVVSNDQVGPYVLVVGPDHKVAQQRITAGGVQNGLRAVTAGLTPESEVVVDGLQAAVPGNLVAPVAGTIAPSPERPQTPAQ